MSGIAGAVSDAAATSPSSPSSSPSPSSEEAHVHELSPPRRRGLHQGSHGGGRTDDLRSDVGLLDVVADVLSKVFCGVVVGVEGGPGRVRRAKKRWSEFFFLCFSFFFSSLLFSLPVFFHSPSKTNKKEKLTGIEAGLSTLIRRGSSPSPPPPPPPESSPPPPPPPPSPSPPLSFFIFAASSFFFSSSLLPVRRSLTL